VSLTCREALTPKAILLGLLGLVIAPHSASDSTLPPQDARVLKLEAFFESYNCQRPFYVRNYLDAADTYAIDYRILPAISMLESTCGSYQRRNNHWGWNPEGTGFSSVAAGIDFISEQLANGPYYREKTLQEKLLTYNPKPAYAREVRRLMKEIERGASGLHND
jgi:hypothetical protein